MAKKSVTFTPQLFEPVGINNFSGEVFKCFTKGDTLPFRFTLKNKDGSDLDITDWTAFVVITDLAAKEGVAVEDQNLIEIEIPLVTQTDKGGIFEGEISDSETNGLTAGLNKAQAKYVTDAGATHYIDMCILEVYPNLTTTVL
jgi:hypothetical protein